MAAKKGSRKAMTVKRKSAPRAKKGKEEDETGISFDPLQHLLVPKHEKLGEKEAKALLERLHATIRELPKIRADDPALQGLGVKPGNIVRITRKSYTAGETVFYRGVIDE